MIAPVLPEYKEKAVTYQQKSIWTTIILTRQEHGQQSKLWKLQKMDMVISWEQVDFGNVQLMRCQILLMMLCVTQDSVKNNMTYQRANRLFLL